MHFFHCLLTQLCQLKIVHMLYVYNFNVTLKSYLHVLALDYTTVAVIWKVSPVKPVNHTSWMTVVTPSDRPKSVRNRCVIELLCDVFVLSCCSFHISVGIRALVIGLSQISPFFLLVADFTNISFEMILRTMNM